MTTPRNRRKCRRQKAAPMPENTKPAAAQAETRLAYTLPVVEAVGAYLLSRPMAEVRHLVAALETAGIAVQVQPAEPSADNSRDN